MADTDEACNWMKAGASTGPQRRGMIWDRARNRWVKSPHLERLPQVGFHGDSLKSMRPSKPSSRWIDVMKKDGNVVHDPITPAAAAEASDDDIARAHRKYRDKGWIRVGCCPVREVVAGRLRQRDLISKDCAPGAKLCEEDELGTDSEGRLMPPCPHYLAELDARQALQRDQYQKEVVAHRTAEEKQLAAQAASTNATIQLAEAIRSSSALQQLAAPPPAATTPGLAPVATAPAAEPAASSSPAATTESTAPELPPATTPKGSGRK